MSLPMLPIAALMVEALTSMIDAHQQRAVDNALRYARSNESEDGSVTLVHLGIVAELNELLAVITENADSYNVIAGQAIGVTPNV